MKDFYTTPLLKCTLAELVVLVVRRTYTGVVPGEGTGFWEFEDWIPECAGLMQF